MGPSGSGYYGSINPYESGKPLPVKTQLEELESSFGRFMQDPFNVFWQNIAEIFITLAPKKKPNKKNSRKGIHYEYAQRMGERFVKERPLNKGVLEFVEIRLRRTPAGDLAKKALEKLERPANLLKKDIEKLVRAINKRRSRPRFSD